MKFRNIQEAIESINAGAAKKAWAYIIRYEPETADVIQYMVDQKCTESQIMAEFIRAYGPTEERTVHKISLVVRALVAGKVLE